MEESNEKTYPLLSLLKYVTIILLFFLLFKMYKKEKNTRIEQETLIEASTRDVVTWKNKNGESLAKIQVLETRRKKDFLAFQTKDSTIQELKLLVKKHKDLFKDSKGTAGIIKTETVIEATGVTTASVEPNSDSPVYTSFIKDKWYDIETIAAEDTTKVSLKTFHNLSLVIGSERQGLFKKRKTFATAKDENIYSNIKDMKIYNVVEDKKHFVIGPYAGGGLTLLNRGVYTGWQIGFGVTYKLLEF